MLTASGAFALAQGSLFQRVSGTCSLDLPAGPYVDFSKALRTIQFDDALQTDLPDGIRDIVGFGTKGGSVTFAGSVDPNHDPDKNAYWLFNPDNTLSPLYRLKVKGSGLTFDFGQVLYGSLTPEVYRQITGVITSVDIDHDSGSATLGFVDLSGNTSGAWGALPEIPAVITAPPYNAGLTSEFPMDQVIRSINGGVSSWPAARPGATLAVGNRSSITPEVGSIDTTHSQPAPRFAAGAMGSGLAGFNVAATDLQNLVWSLAAPPVLDFCFDTWVTGVDVGTALFGPGKIVSVAGPPTVYQLAGIIVTVDPTGVHITSLGVTLATTPGPGKHYVGLHVSYTGGIGGTFSGTIYFDGLTQGFSGVSGSTAQIPSGFTSFGLVNLTGGATLGPVITDNSSSLTPNNAFVPVAVLDPSLNPLSVVPEIAAGTAGMDACQQMAAAEFGYFRIDGQGIARFSNRVTLAQQAVSRTISSVTSLKDLKTSQGASTEYNNIQVPFTEWNFGAPTAVFNLQSNKLIPRNQTVTWTQPLGDGVLTAAIDTTATMLVNGHNPLDGGTYYRVSVDPNGLTGHPGIVITVAQLTSGTVQITAHNPTTINAYLTTPSQFTDFTAGSIGSGLWIGGIPVTPADEATATATYGNGQSNYAMGSNPYVQFQTAAQTLAGWLLCQLFVSIRDFTDVEIVPDARIETGDIDRLQDLIRSGIDEYVYVWGRSFTAEFPAPGETGGTWSMTLNVRALGPPGAWLGGIPGRSEVGTTNYAYA